MHAPKQTNNEFAARKNNPATTLNHQITVLFIFLGTLQPQLMGKDDNLFSDCYDEKFILFRKVERALRVRIVCVFV